MGVCSVGEGGREWAPRLLEERLWSFVDESLLEPEKESGNYRTISWPW